VYKRQVFGYLEQTPVIELFVMLPEGFIAFFPKGRVTDQMTGIDKVEDFVHVTALAQLLAHMGKLFAQLLRTNLLTSLTEKAET